MVGDEFSGISRSDAQQMDAADPLARFRDDFVFADQETIYLDGNSLGRLHRDVPAAVSAVVTEQWGNQLIGSWGNWIEWSGALGDRLAASVLGARPGEVVVSDSTSVNFYKLAVAALDAAGPGRDVIVLDAEEFPTNRYIVQGLAQARGLRLRVVSSDLDEGLSTDDLGRVIDQDVALVVLSMVSYRCGAVQDMAAVNELAREAGTKVLWDLCHAAGAVPIDLTGTGAELAVGCTYKYLNAGPGAPAFLYVRKELQTALRQPIWGWFGQRDQFGMGADYDPVDDVGRFLVSTPPILAMAPLGPSLTSFEQAGPAALRAKSVAQCQLLLDLTREWLEPLGFRAAIPAEPGRRGGHVSLEHAEAWRICRALAEKAKVITDFRVPSRIRITPVPLYTRFTDVWDSADRLREVVESRQYEAFAAERSRVT
ncbi:kynureninase [Kineosporia sp. NBRC 101677]|uniref:kynureninase n=1 Tax=Kineosporia sp. NBRC 101677 TaxID=3032197 RepID=UPI0024A13A4D|nr:kynureninase [Kineosporia sp. NBRC 101677]GLY15522.1 kynureninase [Kineosporia sp. NBRC 101677]